MGWTENRVNLDSNSYVHNYHCHVPQQKHYFMDVPIFRHIYNLPVVPHKAAAEVSRIGHL